jgi:hypothetical protein
MMADTAYEFWCANSQNLFLVTHVPAPRNQKLQRTSTYLLAAHSRKGIWHDSCRLHCPGTLCSQVHSAFFLSLVTPVLGAFAPSSLFAMVLQWCCNGVAMALANASSITLVPCHSNIECSSHGHVTLTHRIHP